MQLIPHISSQGEERYRACLSPRGQAGPSASHGPPLTRGEVRLLWTEFWGLLALFRNVGLCDSDDSQVSVVTEGALTHAWHVP